MKAGLHTIFISSLVAVFIAPGHPLAADETEKNLKGFDQEVVRHEKALQALEKGKTFYQDELYEPARESLQEAFKLNPQLLEARIYLGRVENAQGNFNLALEHFKFIYEKKPGYEGILLELAGTYLALGDCGRARAWLNKHLKSYPKSEKTLELERKIKNCSAGKGK